MITIIMITITNNNDNNNSNNSNNDKHKIITVIMILGRRRTLGDIISENCLNRQEHKILRNLCPEKTIEEAMAAVSRPTKQIWTWLGIHQRGVQSEGGAVDGGSII